MIQSIPLKKLVLSPRNVRKVSDAAADAQLKADIAARGLLQNLPVRKAARGKCLQGGKAPAALQALAEDGALATIHEVTCLVIEGDESEVREASLAENFQRLAMNPATKRMVRPKRLATSSVVAPAPIIAAKACASRA